MFGRKGDGRSVYDETAKAELVAACGRPGASVPRAKDFTNERIRRRGEVDEVTQTTNRNKSRIRAHVEHVFGMVKRLVGIQQGARYRGLAKNASRGYTALALANIYLGRAALKAHVRP